MVLGPDCMKMYGGLSLQLDAACKESNVTVSNSLRDNPNHAVFSREFYDKIHKTFSFEKKLDYVFIGTLKKYTQCIAQSNRNWVVDFAKKHFTNNSVFIDTTADETWVSLGPFDYTNKMKGFCPMKEKDVNSAIKVHGQIDERNKFYYECMCKSKFSLCPAGDSPWSYRFYESLMCKSVPIVESWHHTWRNDEESKLNYKYFLNDGTHFYSETITKHNTDIFERNHMFPRLHIVTVVTDMNKAKYLETTSKMFNINVNYIIHDIWNGRTEANKLILERIKNIPDNDIICVIDGYDTMINGSTQEIIDKFKWYDCEILFGAELTCNIEDVKKLQDIMKVPTKYRYLNSGGYMGYSKNIQKMLEEQNKRCKVYYPTYYVKNSEKVKIDYMCKIFQNMLYVPCDDFLVKLKRYYNLRFDEFPCFIHFNGGSYITSEHNLMDEILENLKNSNLEDCKYFKRIKPTKGCAWISQF